MAIPLDTSPFFTGGSLTYGATGLPNGLSIDPVTGVVSGTPDTVETAAVNVTATNPAGSASQSFAWDISEAPAAVAEAAAAGHWLLGSDNPTHLDLVASLAATGGSVSTATGFLTVAAGVGNGLDTTLPEASTQTICFVFRRNGGDAIIGGTLGTSNQGAGTAGFSPFIFGDDVSANNRGAFSNTWATGAGIAGLGFQFCAIALDDPANTHTLFMGNQGGNVVATGSGALTGSGRTHGIGNLYYDGFGIDKSVDIAEAIVFDQALTESEIAAVYARSVARLAARSVTVI